MEQRVLARQGARFELHQVGREELQLLLVRTFVIFLMAECVGLLGYNINSSISPDCVLFTKKNVMRRVGNTKQTKAVATPVMYREESESWGTRRSQ